MYIVNTDVKIITCSLSVPFIILVKIRPKHIPSQNGLRLEDFIFKSLSENVLRLKERQCALIIQNAAIYTCLIKNKKLFTESVVRSVLMILKSLHH